MAYQKQYTERESMVAREKDALLANLRSEFSTPIDLIVGYAQILLDEVSQYELRGFTEDLNKILQAGQLLQSSVEDLLEFTSISGKKQDFNFLQFSRDLQFSLLTPLNSVIGYCELIMEDDEASEKEQFINDISKIHQAAKSFIRYVNEIDNLAQSQRKGVDLLAQFKESGIIIRELITAIPPLDKGFVQRPPNYRGSVLIVDDNQMARELLVRRVTHYGFNATACADPSRVLYKLDVGNFDLVLVSIIMAEISGYEILKQIKSHRLYQQCPVIVISPLKEIDAVVRCLELGADDYLTKPFNSIIFKARMAASIEKKKLKDKEQEYLLQLKTAKANSEALLLNIVPTSIADRLKRGEMNIVDRYSAVTVVFIDIVNFTNLTEQLKPEDLIKILNRVFSILDHLTDVYGLEKIKTIGDAYMAVCGAPIPNSRHAELVAEFSLHFLREVQILNEEFKMPIQFRVGLASGPVVAGVIGQKKFMYDLWGTVVNTASRLESTGLAGSIQVDEITYEFLKKSFEFQPRGSIHAKGIGEIQTYLLISRLKDKEVGSE